MSGEDDFEGFEMSHLDPCNTSLQYLFNETDHHDCEGDEDFIPPAITYKVIIITIRVINLLAHSFGSYLLITLFRRGRTKSTQSLFLIHLSIVEAIKNIICIPIELFDFPLFAQYEECYIVQSVAVYINSTTIYFLYYMSMFYLTIDRLLAIRLNLKYSIYCTVKKVRYLLFATWIIAIAIGGCLRLIHDIEEVMEPYNYYVYIIISVSFVFTAIATYSFLFKSFTNSLAVQINSARKSNDEPKSVFKIFMESNFAISVLIIASFLTFMVTPDLIFLFFGLDHNFEFSMNSPIIQAIDMLYVFSDLVDALIYIFLQKIVRNLFLKKVKQLFCCAKEKVSTKYDQTVTN